jgi:hypothetical protein
MLAVSTSRFLFPELIIRAGDSEIILNMTNYIDAHWQPGDIVFHVGDGSWIDMINYTTHPNDYWKMSLCGPVRGSLSDQTRAGLGVQIADLEDLSWTRAWVITAMSPMTPDCELEAIDPWLEGLQPVTCIAKDVIKETCLYLLP